MLWGKPSLTTRPVRVAARVSTGGLTHTEMAPQYDDRIPSGFLPVLLLSLDPTHRDVTGS